MLLKACFTTFFLLNYYCILKQEDKINKGDESKKIQI